MAHADLPECISEGKPVRLAGDLNAKHKILELQFQLPKRGPLCEGLRP